MDTSARRGPVELFSTCPQSGVGDCQAYTKRVADVAEWSEKFGCTGILVYTDNSLVDPWLLSQIILEHTRHLQPLVAVQPAYMHPYTVAKMVASFGYLYGRRLSLNMVAGGFKNDLTALNDNTPHDSRYARLIEYTSIIKELLASAAPVSYAGRFYTVTNLKMTPPLPPELCPTIFISGSSEAGIQAAKELGATAVKYPKPAREFEPESAAKGTRRGVRVGIIARDDAESAWRIADDRFPDDRKGELTHHLAMKVSDSVWHRQLSEIGAETKTPGNPYWLRPFETYKTFCPYLVGSYEQVAEELARYMALGYHVFILDVPPNPEELAHIQRVFARAAEMQGVLS